MSLVVRSEVPSSSLHGVQPFSVIWCQSYTLYFCL